MSEEWGWIRGGFLQKKVMCKQMSGDVRQAAQLADVGGRVFLAQG